MKKLFLLTLLGIMLGACESTTSKVKTEPIKSTIKVGKLKIGDEYAGGIVFHLDSGDVHHGLVCAPYDQASHIEWDTAVALCKSLSLGGYSDWRLPSKDELNWMYKNLAKVGLGNFDTNYVNCYWSSTIGHNSMMEPWNQDFGPGYLHFTINGSYTYFARAVRKF